MTSKLCKVTCRDATGVEHSVEITARSLYEAVGRALQIFRANEWVDGVGRNWALTVAVKHPEVTHCVRLANFENWLRGSGKTPAEQALKVELRALLWNGKAGRSGDTLFLICREGGQRRPSAMISDN